MVPDIMTKLSRFSFLLGALLLLAPDVHAQGTGMRPGVTRQVTSGTTDTATAADYLGWVAWNSATSGAKTETLPACAASNNGMWIGISDEQNTAAANNITVSAASGTVAGQSGYIITSNLGGIIVACDGANTNWILQAQFTPGANVRAVTTTSDTILTTDNGGLVTYNNASPVAVTLPQAGTGAFPNNSFLFLVRNYGAGTVTITPTTSTISNGGSTLAITQNQGAIILADGAGNYQDLIIGAGGGSGLSGMTATQVPIAASPTTVTSSLPTSGTTGVTEIVSATSAGKTSGHILTWDANGNAVDGGAAGAGTVTNVAPGAGLSSTRTAGGSTPITSTGTLFADTAYFPFFLGGLTLSNDGTTPNTVIDIASGVAADDTNSYLIKISGSLAKTTGAFVAGSGNGGLDTGSVASGTWYYVFAIMTTGGLSDVLLSTSATSPTMPATYTLKRLIGAVSTCTTQLCASASTNLATFKQRGLDVLWSKGGTVLDINSATLGTTAVLETLPSVPPSIQVKPICRYWVGGTGAAVALTSPDEADVLPTVTTPATASPGFDQLDNSLSAGDQNSACPFLITNNSGQVRARATAASTTIAIDVRGFRY